MPSFDIQQKTTSHNRIIPNQGDKKDYDYITILYIYIYSNISSALTFLPLPVIRHFFKVLQLRIDPSSSFQGSEEMRRHGDGRCNRWNASGPVDYINPRGGGVLGQCWMITTMAATMGTQSDAVSAKAEQRHRRSCKTTATWHSRRGSLKLVHLKRPETEIQRSFWLENMGRFNLPYFNAFASTRLRKGCNSPPSIWWPPWICMFTPRASWHRGRKKWKDKHQLLVPQPASKLKHHTLIWFNSTRVIIMYYKYISIRFNTSLHHINIHNPYESTFEAHRAHRWIQALFQWPVGIGGRSAGGALLVREIKPPRPSAEVVGPHFSTISSAADLAARTMATCNKGWGAEFHREWHHMYMIYIYMCVLHSNYIVIITISTI